MTGRELIIALLYMPTADLDLPVVWAGDPDPAATKNVLEAKKGRIHDSWGDAPHRSMERILLK